MAHDDHAVTETNVGENATNENATKQKHNRETTTTKNTPIYKAVKRNECD